MIFLSGLPHLRCFHLGFLAKLLLTPFLSHTLIDAGRKQDRGLRAAVREGDSAAETAGRLF
jgi:hypothetical protein